MSRYYINQKFSIRDEFTIKNEQQENVFYAEGKFWSFGKKITLYTMAGEELLLVNEKLFKIFAQYDFYIGDELIGEMKRELSFLKPRYRMVSPAWTIQGDLWNYTYEIKDGRQVIARISKKIFSFMDAYEIEVFEEDYVELILGIVIAIDADLAKQQEQNNA